MALLRSRPQPATAPDDPAPASAAAPTAVPAPANPPVASPAPAGSPASEPAAPSAMPLAGRAAASAVAVPERPTLAPGVELSGMMGEGGFREQQWLILRGDRFIQVTALLYHLAEQLDGEKDLEQIAAALSAAIDRRVSPANVRQLLAQKLIPLGLVPDATGAVAETGSGGVRSLRVNMKMLRIPPRAIDPFTAVLHRLYWPPLLVAVLVIGLAAQWWVFFVHGIGGSVRTALVAPGLMLLALGGIILAAAFHELGHAAALRHGGGRVRGMGAGIYLVYPVFYTDVSDNYRLGRWARVRTDLGGFYFNLVFALAVLALFALTGWPVLLLLVALIDFDIVRQLTPFVRLDGYWALADLTGIPDFFANMGAFLRTVLPLPFWHGRRLPNLKLWVKLVYGLYLLVTVPLLALLLFAMVKSVPRVLATAWVVFGKLAAGLGTALHTGDGLGALASAVQIVALALPTFGMLYIVYSLVRGVLGAIWRWSRPSPSRRVAGTLATACLGLGIWLLWAPQLPALLPLIGGKPGPLNARAAFRPIEPGERGTVGDLIGAIAPHTAAAAGTTQSASGPAPVHTTPARTPGRAPGASTAPAPAGTPGAQRSATPNATSPTAAASATPRVSSTAAGTPGASTTAASSRAPATSATSHAGTATGTPVTPGTASPTVERSSMPSLASATAVGSPQPALSTTTGALAASPTASSTQIPTPMPPTGTATGTASATATVPASATPAPTASATATATATTSPTATATATATAPSDPSATPTSAP